jgi:hypothetical protein
MNLELRVKGCVKDNFDGPPVIASLLVFICLDVDVIKKLFMGAKLTPQ